MERPSSVPCMSLPRPPSAGDGPSPYSGKISQISSEETSKFVSLQHVADMKKENFSLKLKIYYLETTLSKVSGVEKFDVLNENVQLKVENESIIKELSTNKELLIKASSLVESLSSTQANNQGDVRLIEENNELQKLISKLEHELLRARQESEEKCSELEHIHADCMLLQDQLHLKEEVIKENAVRGSYNNNSDALQAQLAAQEHIHQRDSEELKRELEELREVMIKTHEENVGHRLTIAEKEDAIRELNEQQLLQDRSSDTPEESRASLLEALSNYTSTNTRLEGELASLESNNTELKNVINTLKTEREGFFEQLGERDYLQQKIMVYENEMEQMKQDLHEVCPPKSSAEDLSAELRAARDEVEELKHGLAQAKLSTDISQHEAAILRGSIEETEQEKQEEKQTIKYLKQNLERLSKESADFSKENSSIQEENEGLREKVQELNKEIFELKGVARGLQTQSNSSELCKINELNEEILSLKQSLADANEDIKYSKEDFKSLEGEYEKVSEELELAEEELRDAQTKKVGLTDALDELREQFMKLKANEEKRKAKKNSDSDEKIKDRIALLESNNGDLEKSMKQLVIDKDVALKKVKQLENENGELVKISSELESTLVQIERKEKENGSLNGENMYGGVAERGPSTNTAADVFAHSTNTAADHSTGVDNLPLLSEDINTLGAQKSYLLQRIQELQDTKRSLEDSVLSLNDKLSSTPLPFHLEERDVDGPGGVKDGIIQDLKSERDNHREQRKELESELRRIHELLHDLIRQLHRHHSDETTPLKLTSSVEDFLVDSLKAAVELVINASQEMSRDNNALTPRDRREVLSRDRPIVTSRDRPVVTVRNRPIVTSRDSHTMTSPEASFASSTQTTSGYASFNQTTAPPQDYLKEKRNLCEQCYEMKELSSINTSHSPRNHSPHLDLTASTIKLSDFILLCANNWLDELPELMRALRDAVHSSIVDCQSVQTRVKERRCTWIESEVTRLSTRLDAVYRLLQHVENLSLQQPPSKIVHSLRQDVQVRDLEMRSLNDKLLKRTRDVQKLRHKVEEQDKQQIKQKMIRNNLCGLSPSILCKVMDTESVLREAHKSLEKRMVTKD